MIRALRLSAVIVIVGFAAFALLCLRVVDDDSIGARQQGETTVGIETHAGWYVIPPNQHLVLLDRRSQNATLTAESVKTSANEDLLVDVNAIWRISDPQRYVNGGASNEYGAQFVKNLLRAHLPALLGKTTYEALARLDTTNLDAKALAMMRGFANEAGIELRRVDLTRIEPSDTLAMQVRTTMAESLPSRARELEKENATQAARLRSDAEGRRDELLASGAAQAGRIRGEGDAKAATIYQAAFGKDPEFAAYFRSLEAYRKVIGREGDLLVVTPDGAFFRYLRKPEGAVKGEAR